MKKVFTMTEKFVRDNTNIKNIFTTDKQVTMINDKPALSKMKKFKSLVLFQCSDWANDIIGTDGVLFFQEKDEATIKKAFESLNSFPRRDLKEENELLEYTDNPDEADEFWIYPFTT